MSHKKYTIVMALLSGILSVFGAIATDADAAASATYTLDGGGIQFVRGDGTSDTYDIQGRVHWHAENMESPTFELTSSLQEPAGGTSGSSTNPISGGGSTTTSGGGRRPRTTPPVSPDEGSAEEEPPKPIVHPAAPELPDTVTILDPSAIEADALITMDTVDETSDINTEPSRALPPWTIFWPMENTCTDKVYMWVAVLLIVLLVETALLLYLVCRYYAKKLLATAYRFFLRTTARRKRSRGRSLRSMGIGSLLWMSHLPPEQKQKKRDSKARKHRQ